MREQQKNHKIKVVHVGKSHSIFDTRIFRKECISLTEHGYSVSYLTANEEVPFEGEKSGVRLKVLYGTKNPYRIRQVFSRRRYKRKIENQYLKEVLEEEPDIVHVHEQRLGFLVKKLKKYPIQVIYDVHEDNPGCARTYYKKLGNLVSLCMYWLSKREEKRIVRAADGIITATDHIADLLMPGLKKKKWEVIYNYPILENEIAFSSSEVESDYICYTGTMDSSRKLEIMFEALAWLKKDIEVLMIGTIAPDYQKKLEGIYSNVKFCGYLDKDEIRTIHGGAFAGICVLENNPNNYYGLPNKLFEYMRDGLPVIASDFPGWKSIIEGNECGLCVPNETEAIGRAIDYLYTHQDEGRKMGENGRESAMKKYNWNKEAEKLIAFYHSLVQGKCGS